MSKQSLPQHFPENFVEQRYYVRNIYSTYDEGKSVKVQTIACLCAAYGTEKKCNRTLWKLVSPAHMLSTMHLFISQKEKKALEHTS